MREGMAERERIDQNVFWLLSTSTLMSESKQAHTASSLHVHSTHIANVASGLKQLCSYL